MFLHKQWLLYWKWVTLFEICNDLCNANPRGFKLTKCSWQCIRTYEPSSDLGFFFFLFGSVWWWGVRKRQFCTYGMLGDHSPAQNRVVSHRSLSNFHASILSMFAITLAEYLISLLSRKQLFVSVCTVQ